MGPSLSRALALAPHWSGAVTWPFQLPQARSAGMEAAHGSRTPPLCQGKAHSAHPLTAQGSPKQGSEQVPQSLHPQAALGTKTGPNGPHSPHLSSGLSPDAPHPPRTLMLQGGRWGLPSRKQGFLVTGHPPTQVPRARPGSCSAITSRPPPSAIRKGNGCCHPPLHFLAGSEPGRREGGCGIRGRQGCGVGAK